MSNDMEIKLRKSLAHAEARVLEMGEVLKIALAYIEAAEGTYSVHEWRHVITEIRAVLKEHPDE